jgi:hypothetical protein
MRFRVQPSAQNSFAVLSRGLPRNDSQLISRPQPIATPSSFLILVRGHWQMTPEIHLVVEDTTDFNDSSLIAAIKKKVPSASAVTGDMKAAKARRNIIASL